MNAPTLAEALAARGYSYTPAIGVNTTGAQAIVRNGRVVRVGTAYSTWEWLHRLDRKVGR